MGLKFLHIKGIALLQGENNNTQTFFRNIFFSRTSRRISVKLDTNYLWMKGIQV
jgi:hypothetical protein